MFTGDFANSTGTRFLGADCDNLNNIVAKLRPGTMPQIVTLCCNEVFPLLEQMMVPWFAEHIEVLETYYTGEDDINDHDVIDQIIDDLETKTGLLRGRVLVVAKLQTLCTNHKASLSTLAAQATSSRQLQLLSC